MKATPCPDEKFTGAQAGHRHAGGDAGGGVLGFRLDEDQRRSEMLRWPAAEASAQYSPICVDGVMG
jgi:hypothetical protein